MLAAVCIARSTFFHTFAVVRDTKYALLAQKTYVRNTFKSRFCLSTAFLPVRDVITSE